MNWNVEQQEFLQFKDSALIDGVAGTGKTACLMYLLHNNQNAVYLSPINSIYWQTELWSKYNCSILSKVSSLYILANKIIDVVLKRKTSIVRTECCLYRATKELKNMKSSLFYKKFGEYKNCNEILVDDCHRLSKNGIHLVQALRDKLNTRIVYSGDMSKSDISLEGKIFKFKTIHRYSAKYSQVIRSYKSMEEDRYVNGSKGYSEIITTDDKHEMLINSVAFMLSKEKRVCIICGPNCNLLTIINLLRENRIACIHGITSSISVLRWFETEGTEHDYVFAVGCSEYNINPEILDLVLARACKKIQFYTMENVRLSPRLEQIKEYFNLKNYVDSVDVNRIDYSKPCLIDICHACENDDFYRICINEYEPSLHPLRNPDSVTNTELEFYKNCLSSSNPPKLKELKKLKLSGFIPTEHGAAARELWSSLGLKEDDTVSKKMLISHRSDLKTNRSVESLCTLLINDESNVRFRRIEYHDRKDNIIRKVSEEIRMRGRASAESLWDLCKTPFDPEFPSDDGVLENGKWLLAEGEKLKIRCETGTLCGVRCRDVLINERNEIFVFSITRRNDFVASLFATRAIGKRESEDWTLHVIDIPDKSYHVVESKKDAHTHWKVMTSLSELTGLKYKNMNWLYDLETTGLNTKTCGIIEIHAEDYETGLINVSSLVYQDMIPDIVTTITGITEDDVMKCPSQESVVNVFKVGLRACVKPKCIAHNGNRFDHEIMKRLDAFTEDTVLVDSLNDFPVLAMPEYKKKEKKKLELIYSVSLGSDYHGTAHRAAADVDMMRLIYDAHGGANIFN
ncbi:putative exonuclease [Tetraselmis virus 1]|uniref:Putative exonuclease n=1 Tax=Tetraselmis virus 1 TaxID=2060617 RepID=A0A2P0VMK4_9VIRU|nr:putative exonuclease [Tetraselmis virus 1]AUF82120.1 putative exonuclease [Tetraselmis virus 1]